jgi:hypothetical protein
MRYYLPAGFYLLLVLLATLSQAQEPWTPARTPLTTPWTGKFAPQNPLPEYPRPQMVRQEWLNLNGLWDFLMMNKENDKIVRQGKVLVPYPIESALSGIGWKVEPKHLLVYGKKFTLPQSWKGKRILLHIGASDWETEVIVNLKKAGSHRGGYDAFTFDITPYLKESGEQNLAIQVSDPTNAGGQPLGKQHLDPHGIWYTASSGIWQTVWLEAVPDVYISRYRVEPDIDNGRLLVRVEAMGNVAGYRIAAQASQDGKILSSSSGKSTPTPLLLSIPNPRLWSPNDPYLYDLEVTLENAKGQPVDKVKGYFGMRKISLETDSSGFRRLMLNNRFVFQLGPLDQGFFPDGLYTPPGEDAMKHDLETLKSMGFNMIRKHVKVEPDRWYHLCDKMGFLVWQDMPSARNETSEDRLQFHTELKAMVTNLFNHPCIVVWVPFNEGWGQHDTEYYVEELKKWDPTRLVNHASGWTDTGSGDFVDVHDYPGPSAPKPEKFRASVLGEFGGLGLNVPGHQWDVKGWGYELIASPEALLAQYEDLYRNLLPLVHSEGLSAAVYTQVSDIETENNGLITYDRKVLKIDPALVELAHQGYLPPKPLNHTNVFLKTATVNLACTNPGATITYTLDEKAPVEKWLPYSSPIVLKKTATLRCRATWENGKQSRSQAFTFRKVKALKSKAPGKLTRGGITVKMFNGSWDNLPVFDTLSNATTSVVKNIDLSEIDRQEDFALLFQGWIEVPATGVYTFHCNSDDGSRMFVAGQRLLDNDGLHGMKERYGSIALKKGLHSIRLEFFQKKGGKRLEVWWSGEHGQRQAVLPSMLFY